MEGDSLAARGWTAGAGCQVGVGCEASRWKCSDQEAQVLQHPVKFNKISSVEASQPSQLYIQNPPKPVTCSRPVCGDSSDSKFYCTSFLISFLVS